MNKRLLIFQFIAFIFVVAIIYSTVQSYAANSKDAGFFPSKIADTNASLLMDKYSQSEYYFDSKEEGGFHPINSSVSAIMNGVSSALFRIHIIISYCVTYLIMCVYNLDLFKWIPDVINDGIRVIKANTFDLFLPTLFIIIACVGIWKSANSSKEGGYRVLLPMIVVFGISSYFFQDPAQLGSDFNKFSSIISNGILTGVSSKTLDIKDDQKAENIIADQYWELTVLKPFELITFGSLETTPVVGKKNRIEEYFLGKSKEERQTNANNFSDIQKNDSFNYSGATGRLGFTIFLLLFTLILHVCMLVILFTLLTSQAAALFWIMFGSIFFLIGMYPGKGMQAVVGWFVETFGFILKRIIITIILSVYFCLQSAIYAKTGEYGFIFVAIFSIVILVAAIMNFKLIYERLLVLISTTKHNNSWFISKTAHSGVIPYTNVKKYFKAPYQKVKSEYKGIKEDAVRKMYKKEAQINLQRKYEKLKTAEPTNDFVVNANERIERGMNPFSNDQIYNEVDRMYIKKMIGDKPRQRNSISAQELTVREIYQRNKAEREMLKQKMARMKYESSKNNVKIKISGTIGKIYDL